MDEDEFIERLYAAGWRAPLGVQHTKIAKVWKELQALLLEEAQAATLREEKGAHTFEVTVHECTREQAEQVMAERIGPDEDYGFEYGICYRDMPDDRAASSPSVTHQLAFVRKEGLCRLSELLVVAVVMSDIYSTPRGAMTSLELATTAWVAETAGGREAYEQSSLDFNIGDLLSNNLDTCGLRPFLARYDILDVRAVYQMGDGEEVAFDALLVDDNQITYV